MFSHTVERLLNVTHREAVSRSHAYMTVEHLLYTLAFDPEGIEILEGVGVDIDVLRQELDQFLKEQVEKLPDGRKEDPSPTLALQRVLRTAVLHVQSAGAPSVRAGDLVAALMQETRSQAYRLLDSQGVTRLDVLNFISHGIRKGPGSRRGSSPAAEGGGERQERRKRGEEGERESNLADDPLAAYCSPLTERAKKGQLDPMIGRKTELQRALEVLCRRRKNNPVFVGDAGVGKTALAEGLAQALLAGEGVPEILRGAEVFALDGTALLAGTRYRGDFEERFRAVVDALGKRTKPILFIDEIHATVGAGAASSSTVDLAAMMKPVLTAGEVRVVGASTFEEFKQIEKDRALARRLQKIVVEEPSFTDTVEILKGLRQRYEEHHQVQYEDEAFETAARLAKRHLREQKLPDSAIDLVDEAGARMRFVPAPENGSKLKVGEPEIQQVVARMARIPAAQVTGTDRDRLRDLEAALKRVVFGQDPAVDIVVRSIKRHRAGLGNPEKPAGSFLFTGPTGVGKTELARQLALHLGIEFIRFDMSEYAERHAVARLIGAPPGYVGFEQGGLLVEAVRQHPWSVVLLDEIEKAHPDIYNILLQVMDHATLTDNSGRKADFRQVVLIMTSNAGSRELVQRTIGINVDSRDTSASRSMSAVERVFSPEFRNRLDGIVSFSPLPQEIMESIVEKFVLQLEAQLRERKIAIVLAPEARTHLAHKGYDPAYGARPLARVIQTDVRDPLTDLILFGPLVKGGTVTIGFDGEKLFFTGEPVDKPETAEA